MDSRTQLAALRGSAHEHRTQAEAGSAVRAERFYDSQMLDRLNVRMREFVARQEMMFLSTADADGHCDSTFRAGPPGFVAVLSEHQLAWPEYRGNGVLASVSNISDNGHAGLLFLDFFRDIIGLHVNGRADLVADVDLRSLHPDLPRDEQPGRRPECWIVIDVEEAYVHCRKHIPQLAKRDRQRSWGTDEARAKGSDFFGVTPTARPTATGRRRIHHRPCRHGGKCSGRRGGSQRRARTHHERAAADEPVVAQVAPGPRPVGGPG